MVFTELTDLNSYYKLIEDINNFDTLNLGRLSNTLLLDILLSMRSANSVLDESTGYSAIYNIKEEFIKFKLPEYYKLSEKIRDDNELYVKFILKVTNKKIIDRSDFVWYNEYIANISKHESDLDILSQKRQEYSDGFMEEYRKKISKRFDVFNKVISDLLVSRIPIDKLLKEYRNQNNHKIFTVLKNQDYFHSDFIEFLKSKDC